MNAKLLCLLTLFIGCTQISFAQTSNVKYANAFTDCMAEEDIALLNWACSEFETLLIARYGSADYNQYMEDLTNADIIPSEWSNTKTKSVVKEMVSLKAINQLLISRDGLDSLLEKQGLFLNRLSNEAAEDEELVFNPFGTLFTCPIPNNGDNFYRNEFHSALLLKANDPTNLLLAYSAYGEQISQGDDISKLFVAISLYWQVQI